MAALKLLLESALGAALQLLFAFVCEAAMKIAYFDKSLSSFKSTLESINLSFPDRESQAFLNLQLIEGDELIRKCSAVVKWNVFKRFYYSTKINDLEASLVKLYLNYLLALQLQRMSEFEIYLEARINDVDTMIMTQPIENELQEIESFTDENGVSGGDFRAIQRAETI